MSKPQVTLLVPSQPGDTDPPSITVVSACAEEYRLANIRATLERGLPEAATEDFHSRTAIIVGYGPSLQDTWTELVGPFDCPTDIFSTSGSHAYLVERGIHPYGHTEVDPRPHKTKMLYALSKNTRFYIASRCHAEVFDCLANYDVRVYHTGRQETEMKFIRDTLPNARIVSPAAMVGMQCVQLCFWLGYRHFILYGMDCSFGPYQHAAFHPNEDTQITEVTLEGIPDRTFKTTFSMIASMTDFFNIAINHPMGTFQLRGDGLLQCAERLARTSS